MNTKTYLYLCTAALATLSVSFTSCSKADDLPASADAANEAQQVQPQTTMKVYTLSVGAAKGDGSTRALALDGSTISATWTVGDVVQVYDSEDNVLGTLTAQSSGAVTSLTGDITVSSLNEDDALTLKYLSANYGSQVGTLDGIAANCDYATATVTVTEIDGSTVSTTDASFANQQAICKFTLNQSVATLHIYWNTAMITVTPTSATNEFYVALPSTGEKTNYTFMGTASDGTIYTVQKKANLTNGMYYTTSLAMAEETRAVDLGLSVKWATVNVGATSETGYGYMFVWGDTNGYSSSDASDHNFSYTQQYVAWYGDAATTNMGKNWRMPTNDEMGELTSNCTWEWTDNYNGSGVAGYTVTSKITGYTDRSIFLPAVGYRSHTNIYNQGTNGYYWTSTIFTNNYRNAYHLFFSSSSVDRDGLSNSSGLEHYHGASIRAVIRQ